jgi:hypothetical protein
MKKSKEILVWLWRFWPFLVVLSVDLVHLSLYSIIGGTWQNVNKVISCGMQLIGGSVVLFSINANIGTFRQYGLFTVLKKAWAERPWKVRQEIHGETLIALASATSSATGHVSSIYTSLEERLLDIERRITECHALIFEREAVTNSRVDIVKAEILTSLDKHESRLTHLTQRVEKSLAGGINPQVFGVFLAGYGIVLGYFT